MATGEVAAMEVDEPKKEIDEALYSRQLYVLGAEAMKRMMGSSVLIVGLNGLGVEVAKNVVLGGVKSVTLHDNQPVAVADLGSQFFLREADIGKPRAAVTQPRLAELNNYVPVDVYAGELTPEAVSQYGIVVICGGVPMAQAVAINDGCRAAGTRFIMAETFGVFGYAFCDFGDEFVCVDSNGEEPIAGVMVASIDNSGAETVVTCLDETRHGFEDGDYVIFTEVGGMDALNAAEARPVKVTGPFSFTVSGCEGMGTHTTGGLVHQVKQKKIIPFKSLRDAIAAPSFGAPARAACCSRTLPSSTRPRSCTGACRRCTRTRPRPARCRRPPTPRRARASSRSPRSSPPTPGADVEFSERPSSPTSRRARAARSRRSAPSSAASSGRR